MLKDVIVALSLSNLCFINAWARLRESLVVSGYGRKPYPGIVEFIALPLDVLLLAAFLLVAVTLARRSNRAGILSFAHWFFLVALIVPITGIYFQSLDLLYVTNLFRPLRRSELGSDLITLLRDPTSETVQQYVLLVVLGLFVFVVGLNRMVRIAVVILVILSPFILITFYQTAQLSLKARSFDIFARDEPPAPSLNPDKKSAPRILWLVFDEMDLHLAFQKRPPTVELPELDRLRSEALFANNAYPPADVTLTSMPAYITGQLISGGRPVRPDELMITFQDGQKTVGWDTQSNIFSKAREEGFNTALVGWFHPYCRIIGDSLTTCFWEPCVGYNDYRGKPTIARGMLKWGHVVISRLLLQSREEKPGVQMREYSSLHDQAKRLVVDKNFNLILVHLPIPHPPGIYDRRNDDFSFDSDNGYLDNLELADRTLGEYRREMESVGAWDSTTVLVTSDHWFRTDLWERKKYLTEEEGALLTDRIDSRIPFIFKLAGHSEGLTYDPAFNTVLSHDLLLAVLRGEVTSPAGVVDWLDRHRSSVIPPRFQKKSEEQLLAPMSTRPKTHIDAGGRL